MKDDRRNVSIVRGGEPSFRPTRSDSGHSGSESDSSPDDSSGSEAEASSEADSALLLSSCKGVGGSR